MGRWKGGEDEERRKGVGGVPRLFKWHHVIWIPVFFLLFLFLTQNFFFFFFFLVKKKDYRYTFPPSSSWPSCAGFRQIYFSKHLWTLGESRSLFAKGAFCSERFWIMPYQAAMILTRALEKSGGGGGGGGVGRRGLTLCMTTLCCLHIPPSLLPFLSCAACARLRLLFWSFRIFPFYFF